MVARAIAADEALAVRKHRERDVWFDLTYDAVLVTMVDGRAFGASRDRIASLAQVARWQLNGLAMASDEALLALQE